MSCWIRGHFINAEPTKLSIAKPLPRQTLSTATRSHSTGSRGIDFTLASPSASKIQFRFARATDAPRRDPRVPFIASRSTGERERERERERRVLGAIEAERNGDARAENGRREKPESR